MHSSCPAHIVMRHMYTQAQPIHARVVTNTLSMAIREHCYEESHFFLKTESRFHAQQVRTSNFGCQKKNTKNNFAVASIMAIDVGERTSHFLPQIITYIVMYIVDNVYNSVHLNKIPF